MHAGDLMQRVTIQTGTEASDGHRGKTLTWADTAYTRVPAKVVPLLGRDLERARQTDPRASHEVTIRYATAYVTTLNGGRARLVWHDGNAGDRTLELIEAPREVERRVALAMIAKEAA
jgi:SPP1 family predicted phage head-tail adaptor